MRTSALDGPHAAGLELDAAVSLQLGRIADGMKAQADWNRLLSSRLRTVPIQPIVTQGAAGGAIGAVTMGNAEIWGPKTGYFWAISRITAYGLLAPDTVWFYRGQPTTLGQNAVNSLTLNSPEWHSTRSFILQPGDFVTVAGTVTATFLSVNFDAIVGTLDLLADFLL